jgi:eukaryotic-like serine/threonine-protein kinase
MSNQLGRYELIRPLGSGATSDVYLAQDTSLSRKVALKILKPALIADAASFARFAQEARAAAGLFHPNIATVLEMGEDKGRYFIAMRYVDGPSLDSRLRAGGPLSMAETLRLAQQIAAALDYAHKEGFIHRDVKPANILCAPDGSFVLTDFSLTKALMTSGLSSHTSAVLGTPAYIAPEVWNDQPATPAVDQYALACVVYEALAGKILFGGESTPAVLAKHVTTGAQFDAAVKRGWPAGLEAVLRKALAKTPEARYPSAGAFAQALARVLHPESPPAPPPDGGARDWLKIIRVPTILLGLVLLMGIGWLLRGPGNTPSPTPTPIRPVQSPRVLPATYTPPSTTPWPTSTASLLSTASEAATAEVAVAAASTATPAPSGLPAAEAQPSRVSTVDGMLMMYIPAGNFWYGPHRTSPYEVTPMAQMYLDAYWIDQTEVTIEMYRACVKAGGCTPKIFGYQYEDGGWGKWPMYNVDWNDAAAYCKWANRRLPTGPEWEKAARGTDQRAYPWGDQKPSDDRPYDYTKESGGYTSKDDLLSQPSPFGVLNMSGSMWEWVNDKVTVYTSKNGEYVESGYVEEVYAQRGGSAGSPASNLVVYTDFPGGPKGDGAIARAVEYGFRCAASVDGQATTSAATPTPVTSATQAPADATSAASGAVIFSQDFQDSAMPLKPNSGSWSIVDDTQAAGNRVLQADTRGAAGQDISISLGPDNLVSDMTVEYRLRFVDYLPLNGAEKTFASYNFRKEYALSTSIGAQELRILHLPDTSYPASASVKIESNRWYTLRVEVVGTTATIFWDGQKMGEGKIAQNPASGLGFTVGGNAGVVQFDDLVIWTK